MIDADDIEIAARLTEHDATFARRDAVRAVAQSAPQGASLDVIEARTDEFLANEQAIPGDVDR